MRKSIKERFDSFVYPEPNTGCWLWGGNTVNGGYGQFKVDGHPYLSHRISYKIHIGEIVGNLNVCHKCDIPSCVNPDHLFLGTQLENMIDRSNKLRQARGNSIGVSKLTNSMVGEIKQLLAMGLLHKAVAKKFGVTRSVITKIKNGKIWQHLG